MPFYEKGDVRIRYDEAGSGFLPLLVPGGVRRFFRARRPPLAAAPIFVLLLSLFFLKGVEVLTARVVVGTVLIFLGVCLITVACRLVSLHHATTPPRALRAHRP